MARPKKLTLDFFIHDSDASQDPKIKALRKRFGNDGYAAYFTLLEILCRQKAVLLDLSKAWQVDATAEDCHLRDSAHLFAIVEYCVLVELFDKQLWESDRCICSLGLRDRYLDSLKSRLVDAQRKGQSSQADALSEKISAISLSFPVVFHPENPQKMSFPPVIQPESTQTTDYRLQTTDNRQQIPDLETKHPVVPQTAKTDALASEAVASVTRKKSEVLEITERLIAHYNSEWSKRITATEPNVKAVRGLLKAGYKELDAIQAISGFKFDPWDERPNNCGFELLLRTGTSGKVQNNIAKGVDLFEKSKNPTLFPSAQKSQKKGYQNVCEYNANSVQEFLRMQGFAQEDKDFTTIEVDHS
jgi:hypothetical protein